MDLDEINQVRKIAEDMISPRSGLIKRESFYSKWLNSDNIYEGLYSSGANTPLTPHTPATLGDKPLKQGPNYASNFDTECLPRTRDFAIKDKVPLFQYADENISPVLSRGNSYLEERTSSRYDSDFKQLEFIGGGHFSEVFKCMNRIDGNLYAVKHIHMRNRRSNDAIQEAYALAASTLCDDNTHIVRYHSVWVEHSTLYIVMELTRCSLAKYLEQQSVNQEIVIKIIRDVAKGLRKLHAHNIVHMDIKSENILYSFSNKFKLGDLGLARVTTNLTGEIQEGDARYLAREVLMTFTSSYVPDLTKSDVFSFGATIYEIMRGKVLPINGPEWQDIRNGLFDIDGPFDEELKLLVKRMMNPQPELRPSVQEILESDVISVQNDELKKWKNYALALESEIEELKGMLGSKKRKF